jgi:hypothetical protein
VATEAAGGVEMDRCVCCRRRIWPWQKTGANTSWHLGCWRAWEQGYEVARDFALTECMVAGTVDPWHLYVLRCAPSGSPQAIALSQQAQQYNAKMAILD